MTNNRQSVTVKLLREEDSVFSREPRVVGPASGGEGRGDRLFCHRPRRRYETVATSM